MTTGIYAIKAPSGKMYIGSAVTIEKRWSSHRSDLALGKHHSGRLAGAVAKYGLEVMEFIVLEECLVDRLIEREQHWIDTLKPRYNVRSKADSNYGLKAGKEARAKMSAARKAYLADPANIEAVRQKSLKSWQDPEIAARRIAGMANAMTDEGRASIGAASKKRDAGRKAQKARWGDPKARERQSMALKAARARTAPRTIEQLTKMAEDRLLTVISIAGARRKDRIVLHCSNHDYTADKSVADFLNGQGCRHCGFERSSLKQQGISVAGRGHGKGGPKPWVTL